MLDGLSPDHLRVECDLDVEVWEDVLSRRLAAVRSLHAPCWCLLTTSASGLPGGLPALFSRAGVAPAAILVTRNTPPWITDASLARSAREAFAGIGLYPLVGGGTSAYFAELNRTRPDPAVLDFLFFSFNPQVHAADDRSIVENLDGQAPAVRTAIEFSAGKPIAVGLVSLAPRFNPNLTDPGAYPLRVDALPPADRRQRGGFCASWTLASIARLSEAGARWATFFDLPCLGEWSGRGSRPWPVHGVFAMLAPWVGAGLAHVSSNDRRVHALCLQQGTRSALFVASFAPAPLRVRVNGMSVRLPARGIIEA